ncbi:transcriptional regulator, partial [Streptomyces sp. NPDC048551]
VEEKSDLLGQAYALLGLAQTRHSAGAAEAAEATFLAALDASRRTRSPMIEGQIRLALGEAYRESGREEEGRAHLAAALSVFRGIGAPPWEERTVRALDRAGAGGLAAHAGECA